MLHLIHYSLLLLLENNKRHCNYSNPVWILLHGITPLLIIFLDTLGIDTEGRENCIKMTYLNQYKYQINQI